MVLVESLQNPRIKAAIKLRESRERRKSSCFITEGFREIIRGFQAGFQLSELFVCDEILSPDARTFVEQTLKGNRSFALVHVAVNVFDKLAVREGSDGLVGVFRMRDVKVSEFKCRNQTPLFLILEEVEKPGNLGALFRTADAVGVDAVILVGKGVDPYNPNAIRASLGTLLTVPFFVMTSDEAVEFCHKFSCQLFAASPFGQRGYHEEDLRQAVALVMGSEAYGLSQFWDRLDVVKVKIPMHGIADSLNVSVAGAVILYEVLRQRNS